LHLGPGSFHYTSMPPAFTRSGQHKNQFFDLLEGLPLIVYSVEPLVPYQPLYLSPGIEILGYSRAEWLEVPDRWLRSLDDRDRDRVLAATARALTAGQLLDIEYRLIARDGTTRWFHDRGKFVYDEDGMPLEFRGFLLDVTDRKTAQLQLSESREKLARTQAQLDLAQQPAPTGVRGEAIVHELNNVLQIIAANLSLLADEVTDRPRAGVPISEIRDAITRAADIARQLYAARAKRGH
jgi:PAS domain S-box-containing protein